MSVRDEHKPETLAEALPREIARCRELVAVYADIGAAGDFARAHILASIDMAVQAMAAGDLPAMVKAYADLKGKA